jgi:hypothetical protein
MWLISYTSYYTSYASSRVAKLCLKSATQPQSAVRRGFEKPWARGYLLTRARKRGAGIAQRVPVRGNGRNSTSCLPAAHSGAVEYSWNAELGDFLQVPKLDYAIHHRGRQKRKRRASCTRRAFVPSGGSLSLTGARYPGVGVSITGVASGVVLVVAVAV